VNGAGKSTQLKIIAGRSNPRREKSFVLLACTSLT
jgi:ATPase subunit of ABC transporter with duplicated ATPase domains